MAATEHSLWYKVWRPFLILFFITAAEFIVAFTVPKGAFKVTIFVLMRQMIHDVRHQKKHTQPKRRKHDLLMKVSAPLPNEDITHNEKYRHRRVEERIESRDKRRVCTNIHPRQTQKHNHHQGYCHRHRPYHRASKQFLNP